MLEQRNTRIDILAIVLVAFTIFLGVSLFSYDPADPLGKLYPPLDQLYEPDVIVFPQNETVQNGCGYLGALTADVLFSGLGLAAYVVLIGMVALGIALFYQQKIEALWSRAIGWVLVLLSVATLFQLLVPAMSVGPVIGSGGYVGALTKGLLNLRFAFAGSMIITSCVLIVGCVMWTDYWILKWLSWLMTAVVATASYLLPAELVRSLTRKAKDSTRSTADKPAKKNRQDDLNPLFADLEEEDEEEVEEDEWDDDWEASLDAADEDEEDEEEVEDDEWEDEEEEDDEVVDVDEQPAKSLPMILKTAAKRAFIPKKAAEKDVEQAPPEEKPVAVQRPKDEREQVIETLNAASKYDDSEDYDLPDIELLDPADIVSVEDQRKEAARKGRILEKTFQDFGLQVRVVDFETGPVITQFEIQLASGLRLAKITGLADDLAIALRVPSVRIVAPIPGKNTVGVEVPNDRRIVVRLREVMEVSSPKIRKMKIPLYFGKDVAGEPLVADLATLPHLLIAGRTGTGKSVCLNAIISSILMTRRPDEVRMLMIDPKMVELSGYGRLPHLMHPVVTDMRKAEAILAWAVDKMEERYQLLAKAGVRHVTSYNLLSEDELIDRLKPITQEDRDNIPLNLPFIVIVADEMADLMMTAGKEVEQHIIRLAQKSRAVGIHLILATQKPTVDVITGLIKSNLPARISFQVASRTDSRVVLDEMGAEKLLGNGDMLFLWPGTSTLLRGQGTYLSDEEIQNVTDSVSTNEQNFVHELINLKVEDKDNDGPGGNLKDRDELYADAVETVIAGNRGSISLLQKNLGIGYGRAARLIDFMEEDGIVGGYAGSKSREVLITMTDWEFMKSGAQSQSQPATVTEPTPGEHRSQPVEKGPSPAEKLKAIARQNNERKVENRQEVAIDEAAIDGIADDEVAESEVVEDVPEEIDELAMEQAETADEVSADLADPLTGFEEEVEDAHDEGLGEAEEEDWDEDDAEEDEEEAEEDEEYEYEYVYVDEDDEGEAGLDVEYEYVDEDEDEDEEEEGGEEEEGEEDDDEDDEGDDEGDDEDE